MVEINGSSELYYKGNSITYVIDALLNKDLSGYEMVSLAFCKDYGHLDQKEIEFWDNDDYLKNELYKQVLEPWVKDKTIPNSEEFTELLKIEGVSLEDFEGIYELFNKAAKFGLINL